LLHWAHGSELRHPWPVHRLPLATALAVVWSWLTGRFFVPAIFGFCNRLGSAGLVLGGALSLALAAPLLPVYAWAAPAPRNYLFGLTGCRLIVLRYIGNLKVKEFGAYDLRRLPATKVSPEGPATTITIEMGATSRQVRFDSNEAEAIAAALSQSVG